MSFCASAPHSFPVSHLRGCSWWLLQAHRCRDLRGGDVHLVKVTEKLYVALAVCISSEQKGRRGGGGFFVRVRDLLRCFHVLSIHCKTQGASLHLPRCDTPCRYSVAAGSNSSNTNALVFRLLQETFAQKRVHAVTYLLPRRGGGGFQDFKNTRDAKSSTDSKGLSTAGFRVEGNRNAAETLKMAPPKAEDSKPVVRRYAAAGPCRRRGRRWCRRPRC